MYLKRIGLIASATALMSLACLTAAHAQLTTFAQFRESNNSVNAFSFTNTDSTASGFHVVSIPVEFSYGVNNGYNGNSTANIDATLTFSANVTAKPTALGGGFFSQDFTNVSMVFTANTPVNGLTNLLTVSNSTLSMFGKGNSASTDSDVSTGDTVNFSSDFLIFSNTIDRDFALSFSSLQPGLSTDINGWLKSFTASGTGTFASEPAPFYSPDGASLSLLSGGLLPLAGFALYRRRRAKK
ncbi:MAG TPA: hypothetical protein VKU00_11920 [Chthonomonadaceae bacterium]|nr:hypothetical protein [Chthonomonadaceae bacterium]